MLLPAITFAFGMPGFQELIIIALIGLLMFGTPVLIVVIILVVIWRANQSPPAGDESWHTCPSCGQGVAQFGQACPHCGRTLPA